MQGNFLKIMMIACVLTLPAMGETHDEPISDEYVKGDEFIEQHKSLEEILYAFGITDSISSCTRKTARAAIHRAIRATIKDLEMECPLDQKKSMFQNLQDIEKGAVGGSSTEAFVNQVKRELKLGMRKLEGPMEQRSIRPFLMELEKKIKSLRDSYPPKSPKAK